MARPPRIVVPNGIYHVTSRGNRRQPIMLDHVDALRFEKHLAAAVERYELLLHAWALLGNHLHLVVQVPQANLSVAMQWLKSTYAQKFNWRNGFADHLFGGRFRSRQVKSNADFINVCEYVLANPAEAGIVELPESYRYSSCGYTLGIGMPQPYVTTSMLLGLLHRDPVVARQILRWRLHRRLGFRPLGPREDWLF